MTAIPLVVEHASVLAKLLRTVVAFVFKDVARFEKHLDVRCVTHEVAERHEGTNLANVRIHVAEPVAELLVLLCVLVERMHRITDDTQAHAVGKPLEKCAQLRSGLLKGVIGSESLMRVFALVRDVLAVRGVLLEVVDEPAYGLLVVLVLLTLDNDLFEHVNDDSG